MRQAGTLATKYDADRFSDYLLAQGINSKVERADGQWAIWIRDENQVPRSKQELEQFLAAPDDPRYRAAEQAARQARQAELERQRQAQKNYVDMRRVWDGAGSRQRVTTTMIAACVLIWLAQRGDALPLDDLMFSLPAIGEGQIWRLVTPAFLHIQFLHLLFNMMWLQSLGTLIERKIGHWYFIALVLAIASISDLAQGLAVGPLFLGMSGVVYGLFGYAWVRGRLEPTSGLYLRQDVVVMMILWFVACSSGLIGNVANWAHGGGLVAGAALGCIPRLSRDRRKNT